MEKIIRGITTSHICIFFSHIARGIFHMSHIETCIKLAAYLFVVGIALEFSHRYYWQVNNWILSRNMAIVSRSAISSIAACFPLATALGITLIFANILDKKSLITLGLGYTGDSLVFVAYGALVAVGCVTLAFLIGILMRYIQVKPSRMAEDCVSCFPLFFGSLIDFFSAAVFEEIIFRGYVFFVLLDAWGPEVAIIGSAIAFSSAHTIKHSGAPTMFIINGIIFGIIAGIARHVTGSLWLPIGLHFGWNVISGPIFGLPYSGRCYDRGVVVSDVSGPDWLTGGLYSLDAGFLGTIALAAAAVGLIALSPIH